MATMRDQAFDAVGVGGEVGGYRIGERIHVGGTGNLFRVTPAYGPDPGFPLLMKLPLVGHGQPSVSVVGFEMELMILPALAGPHVPRFVAAGDLTTLPYLVMEWVEGESLAAIAGAAPIPAAEVTRIGAAIADALHSLHAQETIHLDLKPENVILRANGEAVLIDFGFAHHARYPDLLAEERYFAAGSGRYVSPEQLRDRRNDPRSDIFALGVILYELATGELPFGAPATLTGMRDRLWRVPVPPRAHHSEVPAWLQEVILRCIEPEPRLRYQSPAHVAFDLRHHDQVALSERAHHASAPRFLTQFGRWWRSREYSLPAPEPRREAPAGKRAPVILVAVDTTHLEDVRHASIQWTTRQVLTLNDEYRVMCVSVVKAPPVGGGGTFDATTSGRHLEHLARLRHWVEPLSLPAERLSLHVIEAADPSATLVDLARQNNVDLIVLGAPGPGQAALAWWRSVASGVTANAHCSVHVVRVPQRSPVSEALDDPEEPATGSA